MQMRRVWHQIRRVGIAVAVAAAGLGMAAAPGGAAATVNLSVWGGFPEIVPVYQRAAADYDRAHPNVHTTVLATQLRDYERKLAASLPADTAGDVLTVVSSTSSTSPAVSAGSEADVLEVDDTTVFRYIDAG